MDIVNFYKLLHHRNGFAVLTSKPWQIQSSINFPVWLSRCNSPSSGFSQVRRLQRQKVLVWKGDDEGEKMGECMGKKLQHKKIPFPIQRIFNRWSQDGNCPQKEGMNLKGESSKGRFQEGVTRACCKRTSEIMNLSQHTIISPRRGDGRWGLSACVFNKSHGSSKDTLCKEQFNLS